MNGLGRCPKVGKTLKRLRANRPSSAARQSDLCLLFEFPCYAFETRKKGRIGEMNLSVSKMFARDRVNERRDDAWTDQRSLLSPTDNSSRILLVNIDTEVYQIHLLTQHTV